MPKMLWWKRLSSQQVIQNPLQFSDCVFICKFPQNVFTLFGSGVGQLALDYLWQTTAEGDFVVMQVAFTQRACHRIFNPLTTFSHIFS